MPFGMSNPVQKVVDAASSGSMPNLPKPKLPAWMGAGQAPADAQPMTASVNGQTISGGGNPIQETKNIVDSAIHPGGSGDGSSVNMGDRPGYPSLRSPIMENGQLGNDYLVNPTKAISPIALEAGSGDHNFNLSNFAGSDPRALDAMRDRAMSGENSPWLKMQLEKQGQGELGLRDQAAQQALSGASTARSQMAMRGGMGSGASERIAQSTSRDMNAARQAIGRQGASDRLGLGIANDQTNMGLLGATAAADTTRGGQMLDQSKFNSGLTYDAAKTTINNDLTAQLHGSDQNFAAQQFNVGNNLGAIGQDNNNKIGIYDDAMKGYGAGAAANAISKGGK